MRVTLGRPPDPPALKAIRIVHTIVWAFFAACVLWVPLLAWQGDIERAGWVIGLVMIEVGVLAANRFTCPLTDLAARYTTDRRANFDIFLPVWLARYNKVIFGTLFVIGIAMTLAQWRGWRP